MSITTTKNSVSKALIGLFVAVTVIGPNMALANANPLSNIFPDVPSGSTYFTEVSCLSGTPYGVIAGYQDGTFKPNRLISRGEATAFIANYHVMVVGDWNFLSPGTPTFPDVTSSHLFYRQIETAYARGFITDRNPGQSFNSDAMGSWTYGFPGITNMDGGSSQITRGEFIKALYNYGIAHNQLPACVHNQANPTVDLKVNGQKSVTIDNNTAANLSWTVTDATSCSASGNWSGSKSVNGGNQSTGNLTTGTYNYTITCSNSAGSRFDTVTVIVREEQGVPPTVDLKVNNQNGPISIDYGTSANLSWTVSNADYCNASGGWSGSKNVNGGSQSTGNLIVPKTFTITCSNNFGTKSDSVTVNINDINDDVNVDLTANPMSVTSGNRSTLSWTSDNADYCYASGGPWSGNNKPANSSQQTGILNQTSTFAITCVNSQSGNSAQDTVTVNVTSDNSISVDITANPMNVQSGGSTSLSWTSTNASYCFADSNAWYGNKAVPSGQETINNLTSTKTFTITCTNSVGDSASDSVTVTVNQQNITPTVDLYASPSQIQSGTQGHLYWTSQNATSCYASSGPWNGSRQLNDNEATNVLYGNTTFTITCTSSTGQTVSDSATITVNTNNGGNNPPTLNFYANPSTVPYGNSSTLYWNTTNADYCTASGDWYGNKSVNGSEVVNNITATRNYILTCYGPGGSVVRNTTVSPITQTYGPVAPTLTIYAIPTPVAYGASSNVYWNASNVDSCYATGNWYGAKAISGQQSTGPLFADSTYTITCYGVGGSITRSATVPVIRPTYVPPPVVLGETYVPPSGVYSASIEKTMENLTTGERGTSVSARPGQEIRYTITVRNTGTLNLNNLVVRDPLSDKVDVKTISDNGTYDYTNRTVTWKIGRLTPGESKSVTLLVRVVMCDTDVMIENRAYVDNSQISEVSSNSTVAGVSTGAVSIVIENGNPTVGRGDSVSYTVRYSNGSNSTLKNATLDIYIPTGMTIEGYSQTCTIEGNTLHLAIGDLAPGKTGVVEVKGKIDDSVLDGEVLTTRVVARYTDSAGVTRESSGTTVSTVSGNGDNSTATVKGSSGLRFLPDTFFGWLLLLLLIIVLALFIKRLLSKDEKEGDHH